MFFKEEFAKSWPLIGITLLSLTTAIYLALRLWRTLDFLSRGTPDFHPVVEITAETSWFLLSLALVNNSLKEVWAEECVIVLTEFDGTPSNGFEASCKGLLRIRELVNAGEIIRVGLCQTVYDAAGRPQDEYSFVIGGTLKYSIGNVWYSEPVPLRRVKMSGLNPIEVRKTIKRPTTNLGDNESRQSESINRP